MAAAPASAALFVAAEPLDEPLDEPLAEPLDEPAAPLEVEEPHSVAFASLPLAAATPAVRARFSPAVRPATIQPSYGERAEAVALLLAEDVSGAAAPDEAPETANHPRSERSPAEPAPDALEELGASLASHRAV